MRLDKAVARCAHVVDRSLRECFPEDFDARCMYAAFGIHRLTKKLGREAIIVAGNFGALCVAADNSQASFQGYHRREGDFAHYWCEVDGHLVDLGPFYLSVRSRFPAVPAPLVMWPMSRDLPAGLAYHPKIKYHPDVEAGFPPEIMARLERFLGACDRRLAGLTAQPQPRWWLLSGPKSIEVAAARGDLWALGTKRVRHMAT